MSAEGVMENVKPANVINFHEWDHGQIVERHLDLWCQDKAVECNLYIEWTETQILTEIRKKARYAKKIKL